MAFGESRLSSTNLSLKNIKWLMFTAKRAILCSTKVNMALER